MSKYTTEVRYICEEKAGLEESTGFNDINKVIELSREKIFNFDFPIYDESYRSVLETKILKHFYTREIGAESVGLWQMWLDTRLNEIMPYYNMLYESALLEFNPLYDVDVKTKRDTSFDGTKDDTSRKTTSFSNESDRSNNSKTESSGTNENTINGSVIENHSDAIVDTAWRYYSDTPQGGVNGLDNMTYLTNATKETDSNTKQGNSNNTTANREEGSNSNEVETNSSEDFNSSGNSNDNTTANSVYTNTEDYLEHVYGKRGGVSYSKMVMEYRETFLNIDLMVIRELNDLFMNLW